MTSTDSMFAIAMLRVSIPFILPKEALFPIRIPSTATAVPKAAFPAVDPPSLNENTLLVVKSGTFVFPPGKREDMSLTLET